MSTTLVPTRATVTNQNRTTVRVFKAETVNLGGLVDVDVSNVTDGEVLVYDGNSNLYVMGALPNVDGGTF